MTLVEKYPYSVEAILQREAQGLVQAVWHLHDNGFCDGYNYEVLIKAEVYNALNTDQKKYFYKLFGGVWNIIMPNDKPGIWLCVPREYIYSFHYHAPLRVHPVRISK